MIRQSSLFLVFWATTGLGMKRKSLSRKMSLLQRHIGKFGQVLQRRVLKLGFERFEKVWFSEELDRILDNELLPLTLP